MNNITRLSSSFVPILGLLIFGSAVFSGCAAIEGIFKAGFAVGVIAVIIVVALIIGVGMMFRK